MEYRLPLQQFLSRVAAHPDKIYLHQPKNRMWRTLTWAEVDDQARRIASGLLAQGYQPGDRIGILAKNCAEWFIADIAIIMAGMISVPIYTTAGVQTIDHVLTHSNMKAIFVGKLDSTDAAQQTINNRVLPIAMPYPTIDAQVHWNTWLGDYPPLQNLAEPAPQDTMTLVYTSGSTGVPKGVVLSHKNIAAASDCTADIVAMKVDDRCISYLPLAHVVERSALEWTSIYGGAEVFFTESLDNFIEDICYAQPTLFISIPRLWTKFQTEILAKLPEKKLQRLLRIPLVGSLVARKIRKGLGLNKCRLAASGSAPISLGVLQWYSRLGINISEGWGMTETAGLSCATIPFDKALLGTIGRQLSCVEMELSEQGEILIRGEAVFSEYYQNPDITAEAFTEDWFHTGDLAEVDQNGAYKIIGRAKEQFKTGKGKYVSPAPIESMLGRNTDIEQACVLGSGRKQPIVIVVLGDHLHTGSETGREFIHQGLLTTLSEVNNELESHQRLDHLIVSEEMWTVENELLTPTLKIRRSRLEQRYEHFIEAELEELVIWQTELD
ncbi:MAG: AMP-dependent synthetase [Gammaproteobacteria bacterium]|nr:MAG: AMP-dependent synthetase [Gammaproteobacteria bacterium]